MSETYQFKLPLVQAAQAQKHVTVNEALARLDAVAQLRLVSVSELVPPMTAADGAAYGVPLGAVNDWNGQTGSIAIFANGGWVFVAPKIGWSAWIEDIARQAVFDGMTWSANIAAMTGSGAATLHRLIEFDHVITAGADNITTGVIAGSMIVFGVTGRVTSTLTGTGLTGWSLGVAGSTNRFGNGLSLAQGSWLRGMSGSPLTYWGDEPLLLTAEGGSFSGGSLRLIIHGMMLKYPEPI